MKTVLLFLLLLASMFCMSQNGQADSLRARVVSSAPHSVARLGALYHYSDFWKKQSRMDSALAYSRAALQLARSLNEPEWMVRCYLQLGNYAFNKYDYSEAFLLYSRGDSVCNSNEKLRVSMLHAQIYNYLGYAVRVPQGYDSTLGYYLKAQQMYEALHYDTGIQELNVGLAQLYTNKQQYRKALPLINQAVAYQKKNGLPVTYALVVRGFLLTKMGRAADAEKDYQEYYDIAFSGKDEMLQRRAVQYMAYLYKEKKEFAKAEEFYKKALAQYGDNFDANKKMVYEDYIDMLREAGNEKKLNEATQDYIELRDTLEKDDKAKEIFALETRFRTAEKEQQINMLSAENKVAESRRKNQLYLFFALFGILTAAALAVFYAYRNKLRTAAKLGELNEMKSRFFSNISHEFRTPLTLIKSPLQELEKTAATDTQRGQLSLIGRSADRMLELVDQLLELSRLDDGNLKLVFKKAKLTPLLENLAEPFAYEAKMQNVEFRISIEKSDEQHYYDRDALCKIVGNLLSNAVKYCAAGGSITFDAEIVDGWLRIRVSNSQTGLSDEDLPKLFERFYQKDAGSNGAGIGLALIKELCALYGGSITARRQVNELVFELSLPLSAENPNAVIVDPAEVAVEWFPAEISAGASEFPILLVVDDNAGIRSLIAEIFRADYLVLEAADAEKGLQLAQKEIPDCIISDVMMEGMDGFEFTSRLKNNELTSFVPVILLTAKTSVEAHLQGLKSAADAFLTKPFDNEVLRAMVRQQIAERRKLQQRYSRELLLRPMEISISSTEERFLEKLQQLTQTEFSNPGFTAEDFAAKLGMSRMQLHRKLKSLFDVPASEFIRNERLKAAADLLRKGDANISEIAYSVGFNDLSYFSRCFRENYGMTPSEFAKSS